MKNIKINVWGFVLILIIGYVAGLLAMLLQFNTWGYW